MPAVSRASSCASDPQRVCVCVCVCVFSCKCVCIFVCLWAVCLREREGKCERVSANLPHDALPSAMFVCVCVCACVCVRVLCAHGVRGQRKREVISFPAPPS